MNEIRKCLVCSIFPIITLWELSVAMKTRVLIPFSPKPNQGEHSALLSTFVKLPFVIKIFVLSIFELLFYTGLTVITSNSTNIVFRLEKSKVKSEGTKQCGTKLDSE